MIRVISRRDASLMIADPDAGRGAIIVRPGVEPHVVNADSAYAVGYWEPSSDPLPDLDPGIVAELAKFNARPAGSMARAAGHDVSPGHDELHHYWTIGEGRHEWVDSPTPWTTLVALLTPHVGPEKAKIYASRWFIEVKGYAAGSDENRVAHGHPPRGEHVGPG